jgi:hypothetical protein
MLSHSARFLSLSLVTSRSRSLSSCTVLTSRSPPFPVLLSTPNLERPHTNIRTHPASNHLKIRRAVCQIRQQWWRATVHYHARTAQGMWVEDQVNMPEIWRVGITPILSSVSGYPRLGVNGCEALWHLQ